MGQMAIKDHRMRGIFLTNHDTIRNVPDPGDLKEYIYIPSTWAALQCIEAIQKYLLFIFIQITKLL